MSTIIDRAIEPFAECMTREAAQKIANIRADAVTQQRFGELAGKANQGTLTDLEKAAYDQFLAEFHFVTILQARARRLLKS